MCKNLFVVGVKPSFAEKSLWDFLMSAAPHMTNTDPDGLGYAAQSDKELFGERWFNPRDAFKFREEPSIKDITEIAPKFKDLVTAEEGRYSRFGEFDPSNTHAVTLHARRATCEKNLMNVHPFVRDGISLVHNGVINNQKSLTNITSTCDSETILNEYVEAKVNIDPSKIEAVADKLRGWYACGVLARDGTGRSIVDIFSFAAPLYVGFVAELEALVFCTNDDIVKSALEDLNWGKIRMKKLNANMMIRLDAKTAELISTHKFTGKSTDYSQWNNYPKYNAN